MTAPQVLLNHVGYWPVSCKNAIVQHTEPVPTAGFFVVDAKSGAIALTGTLTSLPPVDGWVGRHFALADFSKLTNPGRYFVVLEDRSRQVHSQTFEIGESLFASQMLSDVVHYFKSQRCTGLFDDADRNAPLVDTRDARDVRGGWYDASGDCSKYLSHLSYANFMNPQQTPLVCWALIVGRGLLPAQSAWFDERIVDEALHGADFLVRMQAPDGAFYTTVFDRWSKDPAQREICSYSTQQGIKSNDYRAGFRQGGGMTIAALARASALPRDGAFPRDEYLERAALAFDVLQKRNVEFVNDHEENIVDDYCALLAATELLARIGEERWCDAAHFRAQRLMARQDSDGFYWADDARTRSFFHASDAGLPHIALMRFVEVLLSHDKDADVSSYRTAILRGLLFELRSTNELGPNPFGYPRQFVAMPGRDPTARFFVPHDNESGYWWQGENARLASLATAARLAVKLRLGDDEFDASLTTYAQRILDWIFGANPFDTCMLQGWGHNPPRYEPGLWNAPGGVCNGITSGLDDEQDIDFRKPEDTVPTHSWRWTEQWIPHAAWLFAALSSGVTTP